MCKQIMMEVKISVITEMPAFTVGNWHLKLLSLLLVKKHIMSSKFWSKECLFSYMPKQWSRRERVKFSCQVWLNTHSWNFFFRGNWDVFRIGVLSFPLNHQWEPVSLLSPLDKWCAMEGGDGDKDIQDLYMSTSKQINKMSQSHHFFLKWMM